VSLRHHRVECECCACENERHSPVPRRTFIEQMRYDEDFEYYGRHPPEPTRPRQQRRNERLVKLLRELADELEAGA
jgi:hypothetical protein